MAFSYLSPWNVYLSIIEHLAYVVRNNGVFLPLHISYIAYEYYIYKLKINLTQNKINFSVIHYYIFISNQHKIVNIEYTSSGWL